MGIEKSGNLFCICSRKSQYLTKMRERFPDSCNSRCKTHIHHLIHFIEYKSMHHIERYPPTIEHILKSSGSGNDNLWPRLESLFLAPDRRTTKNSERSHTHMARNMEYFITGLHSELTSWLENEYLWHTTACIDRVQCWYNKSCCLTRSCLWLNYHISSIESKRNNFRLHICRLVVRELLERRKYLTSQTIIRKRHNTNTKKINPRNEILHWSQRFSRLKNEKTSS